MALLATLQYIKGDPSKPFHNAITIFSDSLTTLQYTSLKTYSKCQNIKILIESTFKSLILINPQQQNIRIIFQKVKSHTNIKGNNEIDELVNNATRHIKLNKTIIIRSHIK